MRWTQCVSAVLLASAILAACGDDDPVGPDPEAVARGEYLVENVLVCGDCHTPRLPSGALDMTRWLAGVEVFADLVPGSDTQGAIGTPNLTPDATGLAGWTDAEIRNAFLNGIDADGDPLFPIMPYAVFHNMSGDDADAIVAYLRQVTPVRNEIPDRQPLPFPFDEPAEPLPAGLIPHTTLAASHPNYARAVRGRYLAGTSGACIECHTPPSQGDVPLDTTKLFAGGREFGAAELGLPVPPFPASIHSRNLTPDGNGIIGWTPEDIRDALLDGVDRSGVPLCPPMPAGPNGGYGGMDEEDALDIGWYLTTIPAVDNGVIPNCTPPGGGSPRREGR